MEKKIYYQILLSFLTYTSDWQEKKYNSLKEAQKAVYSLRQRKWVKKHYTNITIHSFEEDLENGDRFLTFTKDYFV